MGLATFWAIFSQTHLVTLAWQGKSILHFKVLEMHQRIGDQMKLATLTLSWQFNFASCQSDQMIL
jgi:hypothetical protein